MAGVDGVVRTISSMKNAEKNAEFFSLAFQPSQPKRILASGADEKNKSLGLMFSDDGGVTWQKTLGNDIYYDLEISRSRSGTIYGLYGKGIGVSTDEGETWSQRNAPPGNVFDLALSPSQADTLYAAGMKGLFISRDGGVKWEKAHEADHPASTVYVTDDGLVYAFIVGVGLVKAEEPSLSWTTMAPDFKDRVLIRIASASAANPEGLLAITDTSIVLYSKDGGTSWESFEGNDWNTAEHIDDGKKIFDEFCQECHGPNAIGEPMENIAGTDFAPAPALDNSAHAWHHSNQAIVETILEGSQQEGSRMVAWKEELSKTDAKNVLTYMKSLWSLRSLACQGSRHMACMR